MEYGKKGGLSSEIIQGKPNQYIHNKDETVRLYRTYLEKSQHMNVICVMDYFSVPGQQLALAYVNHSFFRYVHSCLPKEWTAEARIPTEDSMRVIFKECLSNAFKYTYKKCMAEIKTSEPDFYDELLKEPSVLQRISAIRRKNRNRVFNASVSIDMDIIATSQGRSLWCTIANSADISAEKLEKIDRMQLAQIEDLAEGNWEGFNADGDEGAGFGTRLVRENVREVGGAFVLHSQSGDFVGQAPVVCVELVFSLS